MAAATVTIWTPIPQTKQDEHQDSPVSFRKESPVQSKTEEEHSEVHGGNVTPPSFKHVRRRSPQSRSSKSRSTSPLSPNQCHLSDNQKEQTDLNCQKVTETTSDEEDDIDVTGDHENCNFSRDSKTFNYPKDNCQCPKSPNENLIVKNPQNIHSKINLPSFTTPKNEEEYFKPLKRLKMVSSPTRNDENDDNQSTKEEEESLKQKPPVIIPSTPASTGLRSFSITDILGHSSSKPPESSIRPTQKIMRPWNSDEDLTDDNMSVCSTSSGLSPSPEEISDAMNRMRNLQSSGRDSGPLDALYQMTSKNFDVSSDADLDGSGRSSLFSGKQPAKKKRKSRTAFTNYQIFELEKRFLYQKYLSPADRDELSQNLGLSCAQVITWFQNRRAKMKRDVEELKKDVHSAAILGDQSIFLKTMTQMGLLKNKAVEYFQNINKS